MTKRIKLRNKIDHKHWLNIAFMIFVLVCFTTMLFLRCFNKKINPRLLEVAKQQIVAFNSKVIMQNYNSEVLGVVDINNLIVIVQNSKEEIITVDFKLDNVYELLGAATENMQKSLMNLELGNIEGSHIFDSGRVNIKDGMILNMPIGLASKSAYFANLGPMIPVKIRLIGNTVGLISTKIKDYGINNALVEIYLNLSIKEEIITPVTFEVIEMSKEILIASKIIQGIVPNFYGGMFYKNSELFNVAS